MRAPLLAAAAAALPHRATDGTRGSLRSGDPGGAPAGAAVVIATARIGVAEAWRVA